MDQYPEFVEYDSTKVATHVPHNILWKPFSKTHAKPVQHKVRSIPFAARPDVAKELQHLLEEGYIEPIDASKWVSPIVIALSQMGEFDYALTCVIRSGKWLKTCNESDRNTEAKDGPEL